MLEKLITPQSPKGITSAICWGKRWGNEPSAVK
jgi:hypothetical protein